ncbi:glycosyltransferase [Halomonas sp. CS7]|uniref:Glycosyltransferase n=1 Tax=Halomonas pelophila TaxID=3151122 RepID=A0ABV1N8F2_9GAMM
MSIESYKVMFVLTPPLHPNSGGVQMSTCKLGRHFISMGHEVTVFSFAEKGHSNEEPMKLVHTCFPGGQKNIKNLELLEDTLQNFKPDIVINQMPYEHDIGEILKANKAYLLLACLRNTLYSVRANLDNYICSVVPKPVERWLHNPLGRQLLLLHHKRRHAKNLYRILDTYDHFIMFGPPNVEELRYFLPNFKKQKIKLIPNSIPSVLEKVPRKEKRLLWLGRVACKQKQAELILPIWEAINGQLPEWELDVVGDGPDLDLLRNEASYKKLNRINFHGRQIPDAYYHRAAIFFMTSAFEGFPNTLIEAQSYGAIPIVFDSYPVARWIVEEERSGYLIKPFDVDAMASRILEVAQIGQRAGIAEKVLKSARRFQVDRVGQQWQELFDAEVPKHVAAFRSAEEAF